MKPTVYLYDIDGTLLTTGGAGHRALNQAFVERFNRPDAIGFALDGMTDRSIVRRGLETIGEDASSPTIEALLELYQRHLAVEIERTPAADYVIFNGVRAAVEATSRRPNSAVGLGTGNVREGARLKLARADLFQFFAFGGFGSDSEDRTELVRRGAERGAERLGKRLQECRVVVIGDTPKDVDAGRGIGAECFGVGTGRYAPDVLLAAGATRAFPTLSSPGAIDFLIGP